MPLRHDSFSRWFSLSATAILHRSPKPPPQRHYGVTLPMGGGGLLMGATSIIQMPVSISSGEEEIMPTPQPKGPTFIQKKTKPNVVRKMKP